MSAHRSVALVAGAVLGLAAAWALLVRETLPQPSHIVIVVMENRAEAQVIGSPTAPYINSLAAAGAVFTRSFAITHPSQPNYLALFSGDTHGVYDNRCPLRIRGPNVAQELLDVGKTFVGYSEGLPSAGFMECEAAAGYVRKHAPWTNFPDLPADIHQPMTAFPTEFEHLPTLAFVVPSLNNDMHDGTIAQGDMWLKTTIDPYVQWSKTHNALLIVTWDEDDVRHDNRIPTLFYGPMVRTGVYARRITHYDVLRTVEVLLRLQHAANAGGSTTITDVWSR